MIHLSQGEGDVFKLLLPNVKPNFRVLSTSEGFANGVMGRQINTMKGVEMTENKSDLFKLLNEMDTADFVPQAIYGKDMAEEPLNLNQVEREILCSGSRNGLLRSRKGSQVMTSIEEVIRVVSSTDDVRNQALLSVPTNYKLSVLTYSSQTSNAYRNIWEGSPTFVKRESIVAFTRLICKELGLDYVNVVWIQTETENKVIDVNCRINSNVLKMLPYICMYKR